jgi:gamma-glutamyl:cysteine ligase YbdK (ATP-grasp superfamily)
MWKAAKDIRQPEKTIKEVATGLGFSIGSAGTHPSSNH